MGETSATGFAAVLGIQVQSSEDGRAQLELDATEEHLNAEGTVHGGVLATLVDAAWDRRCAAAPGRTTYRPRAS